MDVPSTDTLSKYYFSGPKKFSKLPRLTAAILALGAAFGLLFFTSLPGGFSSAFGCSMAFFFPLSFAGCSVGASPSSTDSYEE